MPAQGEGDSDLLIVTQEISVAAGASHAQR
jgi:hypothetical protein